MFRFVNEEHFHLCGKMFSSLSEDEESCKVRSYDAAVLASVLSDSLHLQGEHEYIQCMDHNCHDGKRTRNPDLLRTNT